MHTLWPVAQSMYEQFERSRVRRKKALMYVCTYVCTCEYVLCTSIKVHIHTYMHICVCMHIFMCMSVCSNLPKRHIHTAYVHIYMDAFMYLWKMHMCTYMDAFMHIWKICETVWMIVNNKLEFLHAVTVTVTITVTAMVTGYIFSNNQIKRPDPSLSHSTPPMVWYFSMIQGMLQHILGYELLVAPNATGA